MDFLARLPGDDHHFFGIILQFRTLPIAITCDTVKAHLATDFRELVVGVNDVLVRAEWFPSAVSINQNPLPPESLLFRVKALNDFELLAIAQVSYLVELVPIA